MKTFEKFGLNVPKILLPNDKIPLSSWAVIACDQYTQDRDYWKKAADCAGKDPSTLNLILPEVYLNDSDKADRIKSIHNAMEEYKNNDIFKEPVEGFMYIERTTEYGRVRKGLIVAVDLESYEWKPFTTALIRATEATIPERIPPRMEIRRGAALELPHIMLLVNDPDKTLVEATGNAIKESGIKPSYDGDLMLNSGHITGYAVQGELLEKINKTLENLAEKNTCSDGSIFMFAVGDGNHSLATAKAVWDEYKQEQLKAGVSEEQLKDCPIRYALTEIVNIYDDGLTFEPIHRVLFNVDSEKLINYCKDNLNGTIKDVETSEELEKLIAESKADFGFVNKENGKTKYRCLSTNITDLAVSRLQPTLDIFLKAVDMHAAYLHGKSPEIDYIHGSDEVFRLGEIENAVTILLPPIAKDSFFSTIAGNGPLPRKSFSMGEASEKRFYLEARNLF